MAIKFDEQLVNGSPSMLDAGATGDVSYLRNSMEPKAPNPQKSSFDFVPFSGDVSDPRSVAEKAMAPAISKEQDAATTKGVMSFGGAAAYQGDKLIGAINPDLTRIGDAKIVPAAKDISEAVANPSWDYKPKNLAEALLWGESRNPRKLNDYKPQVQAERIGNKAAADAIASDAQKRMQEEKSIAEIPSVAALPANDSKKFVQENTSAIIRTFGQIDVQYASNIEKANTKLEQALASIKQFPLVEQLENSIERKTALGSKSGGLTVEEKRYISSKKFLESSKSELASIEMGKQSEKDSFVRDSIKAFGMGSEMEKLNLEKRRLEAETRNITGSKDIAQTQRAIESAASQLSRKGIGAQASDVVAAASEPGSSSAVSDGFVDLVRSIAKQGDMQVVDQLETILKAKKEMNKGGKTRDSATYISDMNVNAEELSPELSSIMDTALTDQEIWDRATTDAPESSEEVAAAIEARNKSTLGEHPAVGYVQGIIDKSIADVKTSVDTVRQELDAKMQANPYSTFEDELGIDASGETQTSILTKVDSYVMDKLSEATGMSPVTIRQLGKSYFEQTGVQTMVDDIKEKALQEYAAGTFQQSYAKAMVSNRAYSAIRGTDPSLGDQESFDRSVKNTYITTTIGSNDKPKRVMAFVDINKDTSEGQRASNTALFSKIDGLLSKLPEGFSDKLIAQLGFGSSKAFDYGQGQSGQAYSFDSALGTKLISVNIDQAAAMFSAMKTAPGDAPALSAVLVASLPANAQDSNGRFVNTELVRGGQFETNFTKGETELVSKWKVSAKDSVTTPAKLEAEKSQLPDEVRVFLTGDAEKLYDTGGAQEKNLAVLYAVRKAGAEASKAVTIQTEKLREKFIPVMKTLDRGSVPSGSLRTISQRMDALFDGSTPPEKMDSAVAYINDRIGMAMRGMDQNGRDAMRDTLFGGMKSLSGTIKSIDSEVLSNAMFSNPDIPKSGLAVGYAKNIRIMQSSYDTMARELGAADPTTISALADMYKPEANFRPSVGYQNSSAPML